MDENEEIAETYALAIRDGTLHKLELPIPDALVSHAISERCAVLGVDFNLIPTDYQRESSYAQGLVMIDDLDEYLKLEAYVDYLPRVLDCCGKHCSRKIMSHYGFTQDCLGFYFDGAIVSGRNKETLRFLLPYEYLIDDWPFVFRRSDSRFDFVVECCREGLLSFSKTAWNQMKENNSYLYEALQEDV